MDDEVDDFLMHYGVKGMKWGRRMSSGSSSSEPKPKMSREKKIAIAVGVGATVAVGAALVLGMRNKADISEAPVQMLSTTKTMMSGKASLITNAASMSARKDVADVPVNSLTTNKTMMAGKANLIFKAAEMSAKEAAAASPAHYVPPKPSRMPSIQRKDIADVPVQSLTTNKTMLAGKANLIFKAAEMSANSPSPLAPKKGLVDMAKEKSFDTVKSVAVKKAMSMTYDDFKALSDPPPRLGVKAKVKGAMEDKVNEVVIKKVRDITTAQAADIDAKKKRR